jgi:hypothetical protein
MSRKSCKRIHRRRVAPTIVAMHLNPEVCLQERMALEALRGGWSTTDHFNLLADCRDMLLLAAHEKHDQGAIDACTISGIALLNLKDRHTEMGKIGATGDELQALGLLVSVSEDFWKRQGGGLFIDAEASLRRAREMHATEASMKDAA